MNKRIQILTLFLWIGSFNAIACDCGYLGGFVYSNQVADIVVYGTVLEYDSIGTHVSPDNPYSIKFLIKEKLRGIERGDTIIVWGDNGFECRPYIDIFKPNTEWILALDKLKNLKENEYEISICGEFYVQVENGKVIGKIFGWDYKQVKNEFDYQFIKNLVTNPIEYPVQRPEKQLRKTKDGLEYMSNCDSLPQNTLDFKTLNEIVNKTIVIPPTFMSHGDSYLIHVRAIIDKKGEYHANGTYEPNKTNELITIENQIQNILRSTGTWEVGYEANKPVSSELIIPILLRK
jgi:hypothetical protein